MNPRITPSTRNATLGGLLCSLVLATHVTLAEPLWSENFEMSSEGEVSVPGIQILEGEAPISIKEEDGNRVLAINGVGESPWRLSAAFPKQRESFVLSWRMKVRNFCAPGNGDVRVIVTGSSTGPYISLRPQVKTGPEAGISLLSGTSATKIPVLEPLKEDKWYTVRLEINVPEQKWSYTITPEGEKPVQGEAEFMTSLTNLSAIHISPLDPKRGAGCEFVLDDLQLE